MFQFIMKKNSLIRRAALALCFVVLAACEPLGRDSKPSSHQSSNAKHPDSMPLLRGAEIKNYKEARHVLWNDLYPNGGSTLYCQVDFDSQNRRGFNVEHVFPMSWATNGLNCGKRKQCRARSAIFNQIEADLHNLFPSKEEVNKQRSSFRFGLVKGETRRFGKGCDFEVNTKHRVAEPAEQVRGEVARAMFYMADRYKENGLVLFKKQAKLLHEWHLADPPSQNEKARNSQIEGLQGNRNPFIDNPQKLTDLLRSGHFY